jgi:hypothetical protein
MCLCSIADSSRVDPVAIVDDDSKESESDDEQPRTSGRREGGGSLFATGKMGEVMKESTAIAYTVAKATLYSFNPVCAPFGPL